MAKWKVGKPEAAPWRPPTPVDSGVSVFNAAPTARITPSFSIENGTQVSIYAATSDDPDGDPVTFSWTLVSKPGGSSAALVAGAADSEKRLTTDVAGAYLVRVTVTDDGGAGRGATSPVPLASTKDCTVTGTAAPSSALGDNNAYVEPRLLTDANVKFIWNMNHASGALTTVGGAGGDSSNGGGSLDTIRFFEAAPATLNGVDIGDCERLRFPVPSEGGSTSSSTLTYGEFSRRRFSTLGLPSYRDLFFRYYVYLPANFDPVTGGKLPALVSIPAGQAITYLSSADEYYEDSWYAGIMWNGPSSMTGTWPNMTYTGDTNLSHVRVQCYIYAKDVQGTTFSQAAVTAGLRGYSLKARSGLNQDPTVVTAAGTGTGAYLYLNRGAWNLVEQRVTMNDSGQLNGKYRLWINGVLGINIQNIRWAADAHNATATINTAQFNTFYGGPYGSDSTQTLYKGEYVMSLAQVGARSG